VERATGIHTRRTDFGDPDFRTLVAALDRELAARDGADHGFYDQFNGIEGLDRVVVACSGGVPVGCGALKPFAPGAFEVKRMFVAPAFRGRGVAGAILRELEAWAVESGAGRCVLETGKRQPEAIAFYRKSGYQQVANYGPYRGIENSLCFEKRLAGDSPGF
jgi:GNAT superfamily N-acetyltransferase